MDLNTVRELVQVLEGSTLSVLEITEGTEKIRLEKGPCAPRLMEAPAPAPVFSAPAPAAPAPAVPAAPASQPEAPAAAGKEVRSPMVGMFYAAPTPGAAPFVSVGDRVHKGDVLCIIEAMKLLNEITAESDGEIVDICAHNGDVVEYGQTLFKIF